MLLPAKHGESDEETEEQLVTTEQGEQTHTGVLLEREGEREREL